MALKVRFETARGVARCIRVLPDSMTGVGLCLCDSHRAVLQRAGPVTMVLDFGRFVFDSDAAALSQLTSEEAAVYLPFQLAGRNLSAYLVDGDFSWSYMEEKQLMALMADGGTVAGTGFVP